LLARTGFVGLVVGAGRRFTLAARLGVGLGKIRLEVGLAGMGTAGLTTADEGAAEATGISAGGRLWGTASVAGTMSVTGNTVVAITSRVSAGIE
jgi:hypothetical protein